MARALVHDRWRRPALLAAVAGLVLVAGLGAVTYHRTTTPFDSWVLRKLFFHIGDRGASVLLGLATPAIGIGLLAAVLLGAAVARRLDLALLTVLAPVGAVLVTEDILKPFVDRHIGPSSLISSDTSTTSIAFPSGHETFVASTALVLLIALGQLGLDRWARSITTLLLALWMTGAAMGLVRGFWHYTTDTLGAIGLAFAVVLGLALLIDLVPAPGRRRAPTRPAAGEPALLN